MKTLALLICSIVGACGGYEKVSTRELCVVTNLKALVAKEPWLTIQSALRKAERGCPEE